MALRNMQETIALYDVELRPNLRYVLAAVKVKDRKYLYLLYQEGEVTPRDNVLLLVPGVKPVLEKVQIPKWADVPSDTVISLFTVKSILLDFITWRPTEHADDLVWHVLERLAECFEVRVPDPELRRRVLELASQYAVEVEEVLDVLRVRKLIAEDGEHYEKYVLEVRPGLWYVLECFYGEKHRWVKLELKERMLVFDSPGAYTRTFMYWHRRGKGKPKPASRRAVFKLGPYAVYEVF